MAFSEIMEIFVCVLAVWGVYCILRSFVAWCLPKGDISLAVHARGEQSEYELYCALREAQLITDSRTEFSCEPVVLVDEFVTSEELEKISESGAYIYLSYDIYGKRQK